VALPPELIWLVVVYVPVTLATPVLELLDEEDEEGPATSTELSEQSDTCFKLLP